MLPRATVRSWRTLLTGTFRQGSGIAYHRGRKGRSRGSGEKSMVVALSPELGRKETQMIVAKMSMMREEAVIRTKGKS